ncbi:phage terminase small subunit [Govanella unica]|uniref:Phage terminase small subunit n=1 Tax=Govanella unica TaxID=2975056 RepID=A0A9X3Z651_9PROT|nr:phage terminase small subunit [Govania unica]MDA5192810.1 phage terminase small subunit [Govania unica]
MSIARRHRERMAAQLSAAPERVAMVVAGGEALSLSAGGNAANDNPAAAQIMMRFQGDMQRLKQIQSVKAKIDAKRDMLPEYAPWCEGLLKTAAETGTGVPDEILTTMMVWRIDTGDYAGALELAAHVLRYQLPLPKRYERSAGTLIAEEIADAALTALGKGDAFDLGTLQDTEALTVAEDMPDEVRAKIFKAIGLEFIRQADAETDAGHALVLRTNARHALGLARDLHERCGVTKQIEKLDRALRADTQDQNSGT